MVQKTLTDEMSQSENCTGKATELRNCIQCDKVLVFPGNKWGSPISFVGKMLKYSYTQLTMAKKY